MRIITTPTLWQVGDVVVLRKSSKYYYQAPDGCLGRVAEVHHKRSVGAYVYHIHWDNGHENGYREVDITSPTVGGCVVKKTPDTVKVGDIVKVIDLGVVYPQPARDLVIGYYFKVEELYAMYTLNWCEAVLRSTDPAKAQNSIRLSNVRLKKFVKPNKEE